MLAKIESQLLLNVVEIQYKPYQFSPIAVAALFKA
jgi:hypothetical protein